MLYIPARLNVVELPICVVPEFINEPLLYNNSVPDASPVTSEPFSGIVSPVVIEMFPSLSFNVVLTSEAICVICTHLV